MSRALVIIDGPRSRAQAARWCEKAPIGTRVTFQEGKRTTDQNALMWTLLTKIAQQLRWHGVKLSADDWKLVMLDGLKAEMRLVPNIAGNGFVNLGRSSSDLSKEEMSDLIELIYMFAAGHDVVLSEPDPNVIDAQATEVRSLPAPTPSSTSQGGRESNKLPAEAGA